MKYISEKFLSLLGLCQKAGKLVSGTMQCESAIRSGKASLVILSEEASDATREKFVHLCNNQNINIIIFGTKYQLGGAIGKGSRTLLAVIDESFCKMIWKGYQNSSTGVTVNGKN
ncbi:MAG: L7Ae/L30e/S12e/Gadd45 family ribosomal protein [Caldicoprobacterales bacterium]